MTLRIAPVEFNPYRFVEPRLFCVKMVCIVEGVWSYVAERIGSGALVGTYPDDV